MDVEPPQGIYGMGVHPLERGEGWVQHIDVVGLSAQAGLGKGVDVAVAYADILPWQTNFLTSELGVSASLSADLHVRATVGGGATLGFAGFPDEPRLDPMGMAGIGVAWGSREFHVGLSTRLAGALETGLLVTEVDAVLPAGRFGAVLLGLGHIVYLREDAGTGYALFAGPAYRHQFGALTIDLGMQAGFGPSVERTDALGPVPFIPVPTLVARYGWRKSR